VVYIRHTIWFTLDTQYIQNIYNFILTTQFVVRTNHYNLKYLLDQRFTTVFQKKWLVKLMEFDFIIEYKQGKENVVTDALSRQDTLECSALVIHLLNPDLSQKIQQAYLNDPHLQLLVQELIAKPSSHKHFRWVIDELHRKGRLVVGNDADLRQSLLNWLHYALSGGHSGINDTLQRVKSILYWKGMTKDIKTFVKTM